MLPQIIKLFGIFFRRQLLGQRLRWSTAGFHADFKLLDTMIEGALQEMSGSIDRKLNCK